MINCTEEGSLEMDMELAKRLLVEGATLILLDVPMGTEVGIDLRSWKIAENFKGVKLIPPGPHIVYYNATNKYGDVAPRMSFLHNFQKSEFMVKKWDRDLEKFSEQEFPAVDLGRIKADLLNLDRFLAVYPFDVWGKWKKLTSNVTEDVLRKVMPECGLIRSALEMVAVEKAEVKEKVRRVRKRDREEELLPQMKALPGTELRFSQLPEQAYPPGSTPAEITAHSLDSTYMLDTVISTLKRGEDLVGELEVSFMCLLVGESIEALEAWTSLVGLMCRAEASIPRRRDLYSRLLSTLEVQLALVPQDLLVDIVASQNAVYQSLRCLFRAMASDLVEPRLRCQAERFKYALSSTFLWDFEDLDQDEDDEAPVIVELDEAQCTY